MGGRVVFRDSQGRDSSVELSDSGSVFIGRGLECAIRTDDAMVSRKHSTIRCEQGRFVIEDLGSANGTVVNNVRVQKHVLAHNDVVQCGSLWLRFFDDGAQPTRAGSISAAPPTKKAGTLVLDVAAPDPLRAVSGPPVSPGYAQPPPGGAPILTPSRGFGGSAQGAQLPYGGPPAMPLPMPAPASVLPYGGPPSIPAAPAVIVAPASAPTHASPANAVSNNAPPASMFAAMPPELVEPSKPPPRRPVSAPPPVVGAAPPPPPVDPVLVELGLEPDVSKLGSEIKRLRGELDSATSGFEREVADAKRLRAESAGLRERLEELRAHIKDRDDQVAAHGRAADELRDELRELRAEIATQRTSIGELGEQLAAKERQLLRAQDDGAKQKEDLDDRSRQLLELSRTKDEGWKKLNEQLTEIDHLREVINEQERMLEERRVGLIVQEEAIKELRADKEKNLKLMATARNERDEAASAMARAAGQVQALDEENKRLGRLLIDNQGGTGSAGGEQVRNLTGDLKDARIDLRRVEADRDRLQEANQRNAVDREKLEDRLAKLEVELQEAVHAKATLESARNVAQDALTKSEVARHKAAEQALAASRISEQANTGNDDAKRDAERMRRRIVELEGQVVALNTAVATPSPEIEKKLQDANERVAAAERSVKTMQAELQAARADAAAATRVASRASIVIPDALEVGESTQSELRALATEDGAVREAAREAYDVINDLLSELRNNVIIVQGELPRLHSEPATMRAVSDAVDAIVDGAENAKGALRGLRDIADSGNS